MSDTHIQPEGVHHWGVLDGYAQTMRVFDHLSKYAIEPDFFVVSGDLIQGSADADDADAYRRFQVAMRRFENHFNVPILLALGNLDTTAAFRRVILDESNADGEQPYYYSQGIKGLNVIVLDSHVVGHVGEIDSTQLKWLQRQLTAKPDADHMLVMHHPPTTIVRGFDLEELRNDDDLAAVIKGHNILGILSGHVHMSFMSQFVGIPHAVARGISSTSLWSNHHDQLHLLEGPGYNLVHIRDRQMLVQFVDIPSDGKTIQYTDGWRP